MLLTGQVVPTQIRAARALLGWSMTDLAEAAHVSVSTVRRAEDPRGWAASDRCLDLIRSALEAKGICFLPDQGEGPGLRHRPDASTARLAGDHGPARGGGGGVGTPA